MSSPRAPFFAFLSLIFCALNLSGANPSIVSLGGANLSAANLNGTNPNTANPSAKNAANPAAPAKINPNLSPKNGVKSQKASKNPLQNATFLPAISIDGEVKYKNLAHFDYANPAAPKRGSLKAHAIGTFDSLNQFTIKGAKAQGLDLLYDTLTVQSKDEPFSEYGLVAEAIALLEGGVIFRIDERAHFHDGVKIKPSDVKFSFEALMKFGSPLIKQYYADVSGVEVLDSRHIKFSFKTSSNRELPLILGQLAVLPEHFYADKKFDENPLLIPLGSGPYKIKSFEVGRNIVYERVADYWAVSHPARLGQFNFDEVAYEYFKDDAVALEAFKSGAFDFRLENSAKIWATAYKNLAKNAKTPLRKEAFKHELPSGMQGFFMNTRREIFGDIRVREALGLAFDFEWSNKFLFFSQYRRTKSYFDNAIFASSGVPEGSEREILQDLDKKFGLDSRILDSPFTLPSYGDESSRRAGLLRAQSLLKEAGWTAKNNVLYKNEKPFVFEILLVSKAMERVAMGFVENLKMLGITANIRLIDVGSYLNRTNKFDYDVIVALVPQSLFPGNEQRYFWSSAAAGQDGSKNYAGVNLAAVDALVEGVINAKDKPTQIAYTRALDRVLLWGFYSIPHFYSDSFRVAFWDKFDYPATPPKYDFDIFLWWAK